MSKVAKCKYQTMILFIIRHSLNNNGCLFSAVLAEIYSAVAVVVVLLLVAAAAAAAAVMYRRQARTRG